VLIAKPVILLWAGLQIGLLLLLQQAFAGWIIGLFISLLLYKIVSTLSGKAALNLLQVNLLAGTIALALLFNLKQAGILHFMLQILTLAALSRLLALKHMYDARQLVWVHYFLIGSCFILHQDIVLALIILLAFGVNLYGHYRLFAPVSAPVQWPAAGRSLLIILPLWLLMFLLFPRLPPFWQIPNAKVASTGLSDSLDPGSIEQLVQDDSLAFRVEFSGSLPEKSELYWRARLYEQFDGRSWLVAPVRKNTIRASQSVTADSSAVQYRIIAEASQQRLLYALPQPHSTSNNVFITPAGLISSDKPVSQRLSYQVNGSMTPVKLQTEQERQLNLQLPGGNQQTVAFAQRLQQQYPQTPMLIAAISRHFSQQAYFYSLTPPRLGRDSVDQFLFDSRTGFCSHYASATALILRAAGIPARVIGGYQGGVWHPQQGYLAVRQREAHAWVEYLHNGVWLTFDPTAAVAPERILDSLDSALSDEQRQLLYPGWRQLELLQAFRQQLMHLDYYWSVWVLGFDDTSQQELWRDLRRHAHIIGYVFAALLAMALLFMALLLVKRQKSSTAPPATRLLQKAMAGLLSAKLQQQSLSAFLLQLAEEYPANHDWLLQLIKYYEQATFNENEMALQQLSKLLQCHDKELKALGRVVKNA
jgi:protein-glutamine gamma-glutamyltransferase